MTATMMCNSQASSEWVKVFASQGTENHSSSVTFMKQMTVVAISTITYLKSVFPEDNYKVENFEGIKLRILKKKCRNELAQFLSTALIQAFEAFNKKYLHQLALCFYDDECKIENLIEYHIFEYAYNGDGVTMNVHSKNRDSGKRSATYTFNSVKERTVQMIRTCVVLMQSCQNEMPPTYNVSLRLYYNEDAPLDYQAPGYQSTDEAVDHLDSTLANTIKLGWVETPYHKLIARSYFKDVMKASHEAIASQNPPAMTPGGTPSDLYGMSTTSVSDLPMRCSCNKYEGRDAAPPALLVCQYCNTSQHAACYGVRREHAALVSHHCCALCYDADKTRKPTDAHLISLTGKKRECLSIFRRALEFSAQVSSVDVCGLVDKLAISDGSACKLMKLLISDGIIEMNSDQDLYVPHKIRVDQLKSVTDKYFQHAGKESLVDVILKDTLASGDNASDAMDNVFSPLENLSLESDPTLEHKVDETAAVLNEVTNIDDSIVNRYRKTLLPNAKAASAYDSEGLRRGARTRGGKRKGDEEEGTERSGLCLRSGVRTKKARAMMK